MNILRVKALQIRDYFKRNVIDFTMENLKNQFSSPHLYRSISVFFGGIFKDQLKTVTYCIVTLQIVCNKLTVEHK